MDKLNLTSKAAKDSIKALLKMNDAVNYALSDINKAWDAEFCSIIKKAHHYAAETELDVENIDDKLHDALFCLLMESQIAFHYFCEDHTDNETIKMLMITNFQSNNELMKPKIAISN